LNSICLQTIDIAIESVHLSLEFIFDIWPEVSLEKLSEIKLSLSSPKNSHDKKNYVQ